MNKMQIQQFACLLLCMCASFSIVCAQNQIKRQTVAASSALSLTESSASISYTWAEQGVSVNLLAGSEKLYEKPTGFNWIKKDEAKNPGDALSDAIWFAGVVTINSKQAEFEGMKFADALDYEYNEGIKEQREGKISEARWLEIDGVKGLFVVEAAGKDLLEHRGLVWKFYRVYKGMHQIIEFKTYTSNRAFDKHKNQMQKLLSSLKFSR